MVDIQLDLFHDYRTKVVSYPKWQSYLRDVQPPTIDEAATQIAELIRSFFTLRGSGGWREHSPE